MSMQKKAATRAVVLCVLATFAPRTGHAGSGKTESLDYGVQTPTRRVYQLKWNAGARRGSLWCKMEVAIEEHKPDPNDKSPRANLLDLTISYSDFGYTFQKPEEKTALDSSVRDAGFDRFTYAAVIDKYGQLVSSDLARQTEPLQKPARAHQTVMAALLQPAIFCTWLCAFPKLGPFQGRELVERDVRDWTPLGAEDIVNAMGHGDTADKFHVEVQADNRTIVWSRTTRQTGCAEYFGNDDVSTATKIEITYRRDLKAVEKASWQRAWSFERRPEDNSSSTLEAVLQDR